MKIVLYLLVVLALIFGTSLGDTRVLHNVNIADNDFSRLETVSLNNENTPTEELVVKGTINQSFPADEGHIYVVETIYVADKDGYRVKYKLVRQKKIEIFLQLNPSTLKTLGG